MLPLLAGVTRQCWTGLEMVIWGGEHDSYFNTGARYNPGTNSWTDTTVTNAPTARKYHTAETNRALLGLLARHPGRMRTITADNGTEFHCYGQVEAQSPVKVYFATPHHSWQRGTNENTNGLLRQYLPKGQSMARITQSGCDLIAQHLNNRLRKRHGYKTPNQCFLQT